MNVRGWLEGLGLGQYADAFDANHIDAQLLRDLTGEDLREMGVASLGHRKRLLDAIAGLREEGPGRAPEAERRQVAVLFADLCSFTELSSTLGAEEMRRIVDRFLARIDELIVEHGGSVDKHIGDATMAVFGAPVAHEDDPLRAVAAAEAIQRAMPMLSADLGRPVTAPLLSHIGIALGEVVAGEIGGGRAAGLHGAGRHRESGFPPGRRGRSRERSCWMMQSGAPSPTACVARRSAGAS